MSQSVILGQNGELGIIQEIEFVTESKPCSESGDFRVMIKYTTEDRFYAIWTGEDEMPFIINEKHLVNTENLGEL